MTLQEIRKNLIRARAFHEAAAMLAVAGEISASRLVEIMYAAEMDAHDKEAAAYDELMAVGSRKGCGE